MLQSSTIQFLKKLERNNSKPWFDTNRHLYESAKADFLQLTAQVLKETAKFDASIAHLQPKECVFRINRDVRFSKDKSPYKTNMGMSIARGGKKGNFAGYYFHLEPGKSFVGGGLYMPMPDDLKKLRQEIDYNFADFQKIIQHKNFRAAYGDLDFDAALSLSRAPKGYEEDNPAIKYIKLKSFIATNTIADSTLTDKSLVKQITQSFKTLHPLLNFINGALEI
ncbi:MAG TPA: TIGR02453 family protein [Chitinophagaceae bacterium]|nr:TIGR02453 family protein [Chitinophagaceae bacterium]HCT22686.1 TIGR02453 family protein [Chitinophagaceae bacterium]